MKVLSVIVPSYNMEKYLPKCLGSLVVAPELMEKLEVLVINDGSGDRTSEIAHEFAVKWPRTFKVIDKENGNYGSCINAGLERASGVFVRVLDADDWYDSEQFVEYIRFVDGCVLKKMALPDLILSDFDFVDAKGISYSRMNFDFVEAPDFSIVTFNSSESTRLWMHAVAYRTELVREMGYRQSEGLSYTDQEWICTPMESVRSIVHFRGSVYRYLNGREGQTCDWKVYCKNLWQQVKITEGLLRRHGQIGGALPVANREYVERFLRLRVSRLYRIYFANDTGTCTRKDLLALDRLLKDVLPDVYAEMADLCLSRRFRFYCVKEWREKGTDRTWGFFCFAVYRKLVALISRRRNG